MISLCVKRCWIRFLVKLPRKHKITAQLQEILVDSARFLSSPKLGSAQVQCQLSRLPKGKSIKEPRSARFYPSWELMCRNYNSSGSVVVRNAQDRYLALTNFCLIWNDICTKNVFPPWKDLRPVRQASALKIPNRGDGEKVKLARQEGQENSIIPGTLKKHSGGSDEKFYGLPD